MGAIADAELNSALLTIISLMSIRNALGRAEIEVRGICSRLVALASDRRRLNWMLIHTLAVRGMVKPLGSKRLVLDPN
jgi:hypothetical protein